MFRPAERAIFRKISDDLKYFLGFRLRPHPLLGNVHIAEYSVDINPYQQVFLYCDCIEPQIMGSVRTMLQPSFPFLDFRQLLSKESGESVDGVAGRAHSIRPSFSQLHFKKVSKVESESWLRLLNSLIGVDRFSGSRNLNFLSVLKCLGNTSDK